ncbi:amino acid adenylation domain-containing protein [Thermoflavimicrobium daqui]|uniref:Non-ribosomal peptide synthetase n=1 Tax=Thermoflavimicrobium daqui TaxID=2137476 RepID=A0A364K673_9BACL|nr:non-ribosomal peptide synthetase [Thermoflavimicrobium daqui]RAL25793.1 non-ribosomal peptide synthetase [Thermoflavimicrobium daqui]
MSNQIKIEKVYNLSPMQEGMLYHSLLQEKTATYFQQMTFSIEGNLDVPNFKQSIQRLVQRHDLLRTAIFYQKIERPKQVVLTGREVPVYVKDLSHLSAEESQSVIESYQQEDRQKGFHLQKDVLMRFALFKRSEKDVYVIWSFHHILLDGWSMGSLVKELFSIYSLTKNKQPILLEEIKPYKEFIEWLEERDDIDSLSYWREYLQGYEDLAYLPRKQSRIEEDETYRDFTFTFSEEMSKALIHFSKQQHVTLNTTFQAIWGVLLHRYTNQDDVVFGAVHSGRSASIDGIEKMVGLFINTVPVRIRGSHGSFSAFVSQIQKQAFDYEMHGFCPLYEVQQQSIHQQALFDHLMVFESYPLDQEVQNLFNGQRQELRIRDVKCFEQTNYPLTIAVMPGSSIQVKLTYDSSVLQDVFISNIEKHMKQVAKAVLADPEIKVQQIDILDEEEKQRLLKSCNDNQADYPKEQTIHKWFEEQVVKTPHQVAVVYKDDQLTYQELNEQANRLAYVLRQKGTKPDDRIGLMIERSLDMIVGILAILKAGGAYVPIDPQYPVERMRYMLADSGANLILSQSSIMEKLNKEELGSVEWLDVQTLDLKEMDVSNLSDVNQSTDLAYVMYTSGTTGQPKGVMIEHRSVINFLYHWNKQLDIQEDDRIGQFASVSFDVSVEELGMSLLTGACLYILTPELIYDVVELENYIKQNQLTILHLPPSYAKYLKYEEPSSLRHFILGGSLAPCPLVERWKKICINSYGPTETTVTATMWRADKNLPVSSVPIGKPIPNVQVYIINQHLQLQPFGAPGELCIGGVGLARGYLGKPKLTEEKFIPNPFVPGERLYRTGDLVHYLPDGNLAFLGRIDQQVKVRGYRIELGEIESILLTHTKVKSATVQDWKDAQGEIYLAAYVILDETGVSHELKKYLSQKLPAYMIPSFIIEVDEIPLTQNGKVDKAALPKPDESTIVENYVPPVTQLEKQLVKIWQELLGIDPIGITDDFFQIGGHSLKAIQLMSMIHQKLEVEVPVRAIFEQPTIQQLATYLRDQEMTAFRSIQPAPVQRYYPVSSAQKRIYILQQLERNATHYNMSGALMLNGSLDRVRLEQAFQKLIQRHESLRTSFQVINGEPMQYVHTEVDFQLRVRKGSKEGAKNWVNQFIQPFSLDQAPLFRAELIQLEPEEHLLLIDLHHIIADGVSVDLLLDELSKIYQGENLPKLHIQYKDFSVWQQEWMKSDEWKRQETYWLNIYAGEIPVLDLPTDYVRPEMQSFKGSYWDFVLDSDLTHSLKRLASKTETTIYMLLLTAYNALLHRYTGQSDIIVGSPVVGRSHADVQSVVGMFVNTLAIRNYPEGQKRWIDFIQEVKESAVAAYDHADYPFEVLVDKLSLQRDTGRNPLFQAMITVQDFGRDLLQLDGVQVTPYELDYAISKFDLLLFATERQNKIECRLEYATSLFMPETIQRMTQHFIQIVQEMVNDPDKCIAEMEMLTEQEKQRLLVEWNDTTSVQDLYEKTIHGLFEEQVIQTSNKIAVVFKEEQLTYHELNNQSNRLARLLRKHGIKPDDRVGLLMERSLEMIVGMLAILKAGGAYVPIDPAYPTQRIEYMLSDSGAQIVISDDVVMSQFKETEWNTAIEWLNVKQATCSDLDSSNLPHICTNSHLAYVIYTSGTTGQPKGVMMEHRQLLNLLQDQLLNTSIPFDRNVLQFNTISFDVSFQEIFSTLCSGGCLYVIDNQMKQNMRQLLQYMEEQAITVIFWPVSYLKAVFQWVDQLPGSIQHVITAGEQLVLSSSLQQYISQSDVYLHNHYGPSETHVVTTYTISSRTKKVEHPPIGKPIANTKIYLLNKNQQLQPQGVVGEIYISGDSVSRGYLGKPELTAERFIPNPFIPGERMYRTGDLARYRSDGNIEFLGRIDHQVKVRGYRIEPSEIETILLDHAKVKDAVVCDWTDEQNEVYLCAYIVEDASVSNTELKNDLAKKLPQYMLPSFIIKLDRIPLNSNGKVEHKQLPKPNTMHMQSEYVAPITNLEKQLVCIWQEVLGMDQISVTDDFFQMGGHSLKAISVISRINDILHKNVNLSVMFKHRTIRDLAAYLSTSAHQSNQSSLLTALNQESDSNIFCFPPIAGYGGIFSSLAQHIHTHTIYGLDFIHEDDRIPKYIEQILSIQVEGPYCLLGYSAGCCLAFEVAKQMEKEGYKVSDLILLDGLPRKEILFFTEEEVKKQAKEAVETFLQHQLMNDLSISTKQEFLERVKNYLIYFNQLMNDGSVQASIHSIQSEDGSDRIKDWQSMTSHFNFYHGSGGHMDMLIPPHLEKNTTIIQKILMNKVEV